MHRKINLIQSIAASNFRRLSSPYVVLLDINMPGAGGDELYDVMRLFHREVKVIVSSVLPVGKQQQLVQGATAYYDKSQAIETLFSKITKVCEDSPVK